MQGQAAPYSLRLCIGATPKRVQRQRQRVEEGECMARNRSPWFSLGYLLVVAVLVLVLILLVMRLV